MLSLFSEIDITDKFRQPAEKREPLNKFRVSECWDILNGKVSKNKFIEGREVDPKGTYIMDSGTKKHELIQGYIKDDYEIEIPVKKEIDGLIISGRVDLIDKKDGSIWDIKTSFNILEPKEKYIHQVKMYLSLMEKEVGYICQPIVYGLTSRNPDDFKVKFKIIGVCQRDDKWFAEQIQLLKEYYLNIKKYVK